MTTTLVECACPGISDIEVTDEMVTILALRMIEIFGGPDEAISALF